MSLCSRQMSLCSRHRKMECRTFLNAESNITRPPRRSTIFFDHGEANAAAFIAAAFVKPLEHLKHELGILLVDADAIVFDPKHPIIAPAFGGNVYLQWLIAVKLQRVLDQVLEHLLQLCRIGVNDRQSVTDNFGAIIRDCNGKTIEHVLKTTLESINARILSFVSMRA